MALKIYKEIQNGFVDKQGVLEEIHRAIRLGHNIGFRGPTGTGKTFLISELAKQYRKRLRILNMTADTAVEEIKGRYVPTSKNGKILLKWVDGTLVKAMKDGDWLCVEEANFMNEEIASVFYSVMDHRRNIQLDEHENEEIEAHPEFRLFLSMNWGYKGTTHPNDAIRNRVDKWFDLDYLPQEFERDLLISRTDIEKKIADIITKIAKQLRSRPKSENLPDISTRVLIKWAETIMAGADPIKAAENTIVPLLRYEKLEKEKIMEVVKFMFESPEEKKVSTEKMEIQLRDGNTVKIGDYIRFSINGENFEEKITSIEKVERSGEYLDGIKLYTDGDDDPVSSHICFKVV